MNSEENSKKPEDEYIGNIWGWKLSKISLVFIIVVFTIFAMRYCYVKEQNPDFRLIDVQE